MFDNPELLLFLVSLESVKEGGMKVFEEVADEEAENINWNTRRQVCSESLIIHCGSFITVTGVKRQDKVAEYMRWELYNAV